MKSVRFAPSPTGVFHIGNLRTAWISHALSRSLGAKWIVRYEDIDQPRVVAGSRERQRADMAALGCIANQEILQSEKRGRHWELFERARRDGVIYPCFCSRREVAENLATIASAPHVGDLENENPIYDGTCRDRGAEWPEVKNPSIAWRFRNDGGGVQDFAIARTGPQAEDLAREFVPGYQWACAIDDYDGDYDLLVRAWDLFSATPQQRAIQKWLSPGWIPPAVFHCALITDQSGHRLEKRTRGVTLEELQAIGVSVGQLQEMFLDSYSPPSLNLIARGAIDGEAVRTLRYISPGELI